MVRQLRPASARRRNGRPWHPAPCTLRPAQAGEAEPAPKAEGAESRPAAERGEAPKPAEAPPLPPDLPRMGRNVIEQLHRQWAAEETTLRQEQPGFSFRAELQNPEMRRLMQLPGMRMQDAYRLVHYEDALRRTAQTVEKGVVERIQQRALRPTENGTQPGGAAVTRADVEHMTRTQREALERQALHGVKIQF